MDPNETTKRTPEQVREDAAYQAKLKRLPEFTRNLLDWDNQEVELHLSTGQKVTGVIAVNYDFTMVFVGIETDNETAYRIESVIGVRYVRTVNED